LLEEYIEALPADCGRPRQEMSVAPRAAYVHVPFCARRCGYCNFTLVAGRLDLVDRYLAAIELELAALGGPHELDMLFIGGGTPSQLPPAALRRLFALLRQRFTLAAGAEVSFEVNPADFDDSLADSLHELGVTRVSLGAQSFDEAKLRLLERDHTAVDVRRAAGLAARFPTWSLDLIFAAPGETLDRWQTDLAAALELDPPHVSTYGLTIEPGTSFFARRRRGALASVPEETERAMYLAAIDGLTSAGHEHYEVSNFARPGHRSRHNENYWIGGEYFAVGPGAARHVAGRRETNHRSTFTYLKRVLGGRSPVAEAEELSREERARERLVFGLRRLEGVSRGEFERSTGFAIDALAGRAIGRFVEQGLLADDGQTIRLTRAGLLVSDGMWGEVLRGG
jgi:oxygen-independent coproporphyrinogen-3 oxidase